MKLLNGRNVLSISLLAALSSFAGTIGSLAEASSDTSTLVVTQWGLPQGSFVLNLDRFVIAASSPVGLVPSNAATSSNTPTTETTTNRQPSAPMIIMQPNLGFQVMLTANFLYEGPDYYEPPTTARTGTGSQSSSQAYTLSTSDTASLGVSDSFTGAPVAGNQVSNAGVLFMGDSAVPPTILAAAPTTPRGITPTATAPSAPNTGSPAEKPTGSPTGAPLLDQITGAPIGTSVPEPSTAVGFSLALAGLAWLKHRSQK